MAHFYGTINGRAKTQASRLGTASTGLETIAASWEGAVQTELYTKDGVDYCKVSLIPWHGQGTNRVLYEGKVSGAA